MCRLARAGRIIATTVVGAALGRPLRRQPIRPIKNSPTPMQIDNKLLTLARRAAEGEGLDPALVCAVVEQESNWNPWAIRYEPLFFAKYVAPLYTNNKVGATEAYSRGISWGLMQVMGQVAREKGVSSLYLSALCDPANGLTIGCRVRSEERRVGKEC